MLAKRTWAALLLVTALVGGACTSEAEPGTGDDKDEDGDPSEDDDDQADDDQADDDQADDDQTDDDEAPAPPKDAGTKLDSGAKPGGGDAATSSAMNDASVVVTSDGGSIDPPAGDGGSSSSDASEPGEKMDLGKGDGKDVITIGDSWMSLIVTGIQQSLVKASGQPYRTYGVAGTQLLNGQIPGQYASAKRADPDIKTVVMTGGGNDILLTGANPATQIEKIGKRLDELWTEMGKDGVKDVVYIEYSEGGNNGANVRMGIAKVQPICDNHKAVRCHFMLSDPIIMKQLRDGIHPTDAGYDKLGKAVFELMVAKGMRR